jgi:hypothetical protein
MQSCIPAMMWWWYGGSATSYPHEVLGSTPQTCLNGLALSHVLHLTLSGAPKILLYCTEYNRPRTWLHGKKWVHSSAQEDSTIKTCLSNYYSGLKMTAQGRKGDAKWTLHAIERMKSSMSTIVRQLGGRGHWRTCVFGSVQGVQGEGGSRESKGSMLLSWRMQQPNPWGWSMF